MKSNVFMSAAVAAALAATWTAGQAQTNNTEPTSFDKQFVIKAIQSNNLEIREAVSMQNSKDKNVRLFASQMIKDHASANAQLGAYAEQRNIPYPKNLIRQIGPGSNLGSAPSADETDVTGHQTGAVKRAGKPPMTPRGYIQKEVTDHVQAISMFQDEARNGGDQQLKVLVGTLLPVVKAHLQMAKQYLAGQRMTLPGPAPAMNNVQPPKPSPKP